ncbi:MAG: hypothetical protein AAF799_38370 [Myxococcota bacterium]
MGGADQQLAWIEANDSKGNALLRRYMTDGPLSIQWYEDKRPELLRKQRRYNALIIIVAIVVFVLALMLPFAPLVVAAIGDLDASDVAESTGLIDMAALVGVISTGAMVALRISSHVVRHRQQAAVFHEASANLKAQLYELEDEWRGCQLVDVHNEDPEGTRLDPEFESALRRAIRDAQAVLSRERQAYFETFRIDVQTLADQHEAAVDAVANRAVLRSDSRHEHEQSRQALEGQVSAAKLDHETAAAKLKILEDEFKEADEDSKFELRAFLRDQRMAAEEARRRYEHLSALHKERFGS